MSLVIVPVSVPLQLAEKGKSFVDIQGLTASTMDILLDFVYTETVLVTVENVQELLPAACLLQLKGRLRPYLLFEKCLLKPADIVVSIGRGYPQICKHLIKFPQLKSLRKYSKVKIINLQTIVSCLLDSVVSSKMVLYLIALSLEMHFTQFKLKVATL